MYVNEVAAPALWLASLTESFEDYDLRTHKPLLVRWTAPSESAVRLRAHGVEPNLFYRMDSNRPVGDYYYVWPSDFLYARKIDRQQIGVLGWTTQRVAGREYPLLIPVRISQLSEASRSETYRAVVVPNVRLRELYLSIALVDAAGRFPTTDDEYVKRQVPLAQGPYVAQRRIEVALSALPTPGIYWLEITGVRPNGESVTTGPQWFYHGARS